MLYLFSLKSTTERGKMQQLFRLRSTAQHLHYIYLVTSEDILSKQKYCRVKIKISVYTVLP